MKCEKDGKIYLMTYTSYSHKKFNKAGSKSYVQELEEWMDHNRESYRPSLLMAVYWPKFLLHIIKYLLFL